VSPYAYRWLRAVHRAYRQRLDFVGASLNSAEMTVLAEKPKGSLEAPKSDTVFMYKCMATWGLAPRPLYWRRFQVCYAVGHFTFWTSLSLSGITTYSE